MSDPDLPAAIHNVAAYLERLRLLHFLTRKSNSRNSEFLTRAFADSTIISCICDDAGHGSVSHLLAGVSVHLDFTMVLHQVLFPRCAILCSHHVCVSHSPSKARSMG